MSKSKSSKTSRSNASLWLGIDCFAWVRLLAGNRCAVELTKLPQVLLISVVSVFNTCLRWVETLCYGAAVRKIELPDDPVFIIGHWRTGTTMLHELMALDPRNRCPSTFESLSPNHFLLSERFVRKLAWWILPRTRPFDNMRMSFDRPQEDEAALALRGQPSPFLTVAFPSRAVQNSDYITLEELSPRELSAWKARFARYLRLLLFKRSGRLVLKAPQHTFRLPVLNEMFPKAKFVYLVRDPYAVFPSTVHFWSTMYEVYGLQSFREQDVRDHVLSNFEQMHTRLEATRGQVSPDRFLELKYEQLTEDPVELMGRLYDFLGESDFESVRPEIEKYAQRSRRYQTNAYALTAEDLEAIGNRWAPYIETHGYDAAASAV
ncbi:MAG: sulfotransferase family protein [Bythopirellula sp.]